MDDFSTDKTVEVSEDYFKVIRLEKNMGPAKARNIGIKQTSGDIVAFVDSDCEATPEWIEEIYNHFQKYPQEQVIMGKVRIPDSTYMGDSISALGFPGGGSIGFDKIWHVDENNLTDHITSCNFAAKKQVFEENGYFDESFPLPGCEDPELSYRLTQHDVPIRYTDDVVVFHEARTSFSSFVRWQIVRGRGNYYFKQKIGSVKGFLKLRIWSSLNIIKAFYKDSKFPLIFFLLFTSFVLQQYGFIFEKRRAGKD